MDLTGLNPAHAPMAELELLHFDGSHRSRALKSQSHVARSGGEPPHPSGGSASETRSDPETSFTCRRDEDAEKDQLIGADPKVSRMTRSSEEDEEELMEEEEELYWLSDEDLSSSGKSADYGFIIAVACLVTGISLVAVTYTVPRDVRVDPDSVSAREMERLEREGARVGAHLDRCVIAGLCLLTLGGVLLSALLMVSMWKGERMRRRAFAYSKHTLYGSGVLRAGSGPAPES